MPKILSFSGPIKAGKDTIADFFIQNYGAVRFSFGDHLKEVVSRLYDIPLANFHDQLLKTQGHPNLPEGATIRTALQKIGTEALRAYDNDVWTSALRRKLQAASAELIVITDARFPNEIAMLEEVGANLFYVHRESAEEVLYRPLMARLVRQAYGFDCPVLAEYITEFGISLGSFHASEAYNLQFVCDPRFISVLNNVDAKSQPWDLMLHTLLEAQCPSHS